MVLMHVVRSEAPAAVAVRVRVGQRYGGDESGVALVCDIDRIDVLGVVCAVIGDRFLAADE